MKYPAEVLTRAEVHALIGACSRRAPTGIRNRALIITLYRAGLRIGEALALKPKDLDADAGTIRVLHSKGDKARTVSMDATAFDAVGRWVSVRKCRGPVFSTLDGKPITQAYIRALLPRLAKRAKIEKRVHAHGLRHTFAYEMANEGQPIHVIQQALGHANAAIASLYINHLAPADRLESCNISLFGQVIAEWSSEERSKGCFP